MLIYLSNFLSNHRQIFKYLNYHPFYVKYSEIYKKIAKNLLFHQPIHGVILSSHKYFKIYLMSDLNMALYVDTLLAFRVRADFLGRRTRQKETGSFLLLDNPAAVLAGWQARRPSQAGRACHRASRLQRPAFYEGADGQDGRGSAGMVNPTMEKPANGFQTLLDEKMKNPTLTCAFCNIESALSSANSLVVIAATPIV